MTDLGQLNELFDDHGTAEAAAFYLRTFNRATFDELARGNTIIRQGTSNCRWISYETSDTKSEDTYFDDNAAPSQYGVIRFQEPVVIFGRSSRAKASSSVCDIGGSKNDTSREHFSVSWRLDKNAWVIKSMKGGVRFNHECRLRKNRQHFLGLNPEEPNHVSVRDGYQHLEFEIVCNPSFQVDLNTLLPKLKNYELDTSDGSQASSTDALSGVDNDEPDLKLFYYFRDQQIAGSRDVDLIRAMDATTLRWYVAKPYRLEDRLELIKRMEDLHRLQLNPQFVCDVDYRVEKDSIHMLNEYHRDAENLETIFVNSEGHGTLEFALRLFWSLLIMVRNVHEHGCSHGNVCSLTVLIENGDPDQLLLAGWSDWRPDSSLAAHDCRQIFRIVARYLQSGKVRHPRHWLGVPFLDKLFGEMDDEQWTHTPRSIWAELKWSQTHSPSLWGTIRMKRVIPFRSYICGGERILHVGDLYEFLLLKALSKKNNRMSWEEFTRFGVMLEDLLTRRTQKIHASVGGHIALYIEKRFPDVRLGFSSLEGMFLSEDNRQDEVLQDDVPICIDVPYHLGNGWVNLEYLWWMSCHECPTWPTAVKNSIEIRGFCKIRGMYTSIEQLTSILASGNLFYDKSLLAKARNNTLDSYTHEKFCLLAPHQYSELFIGNKTSKEVHSIHQPAIPWGRFLSLYFNNEDVLESMRDLEPQKLLLDAVERTSSTSCPSSLGSVVDDEKFEFRRGQKDSHSRTSTWVNALQVAKRRRRK